MCATFVEKLLLIVITLENLKVNGVDGKVTCYVCSYSGQDVVNGTGITDTCTPTNFRPEVTQTIECDGGCETIAYKDSKKDKIRHFHRNCVDGHSGRVLNDRCIDTSTKTLFEEKCECLRSFCNESTLPSASLSVLSMSLTIIMMMALSQVSLEEPREQLSH